MAQYFIRRGGRRSVGSLYQLCCADCAWAIRFWNGHRVGAGNNVRVAGAQYRGAGDDVCALSRFGSLAEACDCALSDYGIRTNGRVAASAGASHAVSY